MGPKTTPSLISKGGYQIPPPLAWDEIDTPWDIGLIIYQAYLKKASDIYQKYFWHISDKPQTYLRKRHRVNKSQAYLRKISDQTLDACQV